MAHLRGDLDPETADRLLAGRLLPDDAPHGYREVAQLLHDAHMEDGPSDAVEDAVVVAMVDAIHFDNDAQPTTPRIMRRVLTAKAVAAGVVVAFGATGAAAATGALPDPAQAGLSRAAERVGISLPRPADDQAPDPTTDEGPAREESGGEAPAQPAATVEATEPGEPDPAGRGSDVPSTAGDNHGNVVSDIARDADPEGGKGDEVAPVARDNHGRDVRSDSQPEADPELPPDPTPGPGSATPPEHSNAGGNGNGNGPGNSNARGNGAGNNKP